MSVDCGIETVGFDTSQTCLNVEADAILANVQASIRRGHPQLVRQDGIRPEPVVLLGSGPSLADDEDTIVDLVHHGAKLVTANGSYHWALARHLKPSAQVLLDARAFNARFVEPAVPDCAYLIASQCHPAVWDAVEGRERVWIYHPLADNVEGPVKDALDAYYLKRWAAVPGGCTVISRALWLLRMQGYVRFDLFGVDCCVRPDAHHAVPQPENDHDVPFPFVLEPTGRPDLARSFSCTLWQIRQFEDLMGQIKHLGQHFLLRVHGDGLLAYALHCASVAGDVTVVAQEAER
jgi:hypothetical protein